jgi:hypothetical protein
MTPSGAQWVNELGTKENVGLRVIKETATQMEIEKSGDAHRPNTRAWR